MATMKKEGSANYPASAYLVVEDASSPSTWHLRVKDESGAADHTVMGAAWAALHSGFRGNKYEGPGKAEAMTKLKKLYKSEGMDWPGATKATESLDEQSNNARQAFWDQYGEPLREKLMGCYVLEVYSDHIIAQVGDKMYSIDYSKNDAGDIAFVGNSDWTEVEKDYVPIKSSFVAWYGSEVKALEGGKVAGYLVTFGGPDTTDLSRNKDYFTKETDFGFHTSTPTFYEHGLDMKIGTRVLGRGSMKIDDVGVWVEAQLEMRDEYEKAIYALAKKGKLGWSSGTAPHLVERKTVGSAHYITKWPLGLDASLTITPADWRNEVVSLKSIKQTDIDAIIKESQDSVSDNAQVAVEAEGDTTMPEEVKKTQALPSDDMITSAIDKVAAEIKTQNEAKAQQEKKSLEFEERVRSVVQEAMKAVPANNGGSAASHITIDSAKNESKHFWGYIRTGNVQPYLKTAIDLNEGDNEQGLYLVPKDFYPKIVAKRDELSIVRAAGATVISTSLKVVDIPIEGTKEDKFVVPGEKTSYDENAVEPFGQVTATILKYTRMVKISEELLSDQAADLESFLAGRLGRAAARTENDIFLTGASTLGIVTTSGLGATAPSTSAISVANVQNMYYALPSFYREGANWVMRGATEGYIRQLAVANQFAFVQTPQGQSGSTGFSWLVSPNSRVFNSDEMDAIGSATKSVLFGNLEFYTIVERASFAIRRMNELYAASGQVGILCAFRVGGAVTQSEAFVHLLHPTTT